MTTTTTPQIITVEVDGKQIAFTDQSIFEVQVGRYKGAYRTRWRFTGDIWQAAHYYRCINIGNGYKKRLVCKTFNKPVLARAFS